jgi:hypothetical protein
VSAWLRSSMIRGLAGCNVDLRQGGHQGGPMLTHQSLEGEHASSALLPGAGRPADPSQRSGALAHGLRHLTVGDDPAVAHDHGTAPEVRLA